MTWPGPSPFCMYLLYDGVKLNSLRLPPVCTLSHLIVLYRFKGTSDVIEAVSTKPDPYTTLVDCVERVTIMEPN